SPSHVSTKCSHSLHPSDTRVDAYCPICRVVMELEFLDAITEAYKEAGGPRFTRDVDPERHRPLRSAWHMARRDHERTLEEHRTVAFHERTWEVQNPACAPAA
ncbi:hypothetical protein CC86DRAFT_272237, partial [Ophiobolus disseminans]